MMNKILFYGCALLVLISLPACKARKTQETDFDRGKILYNAHCASCHGVAGKGDGPVAVYLNPKPRDLTSGIFKYRTGRGPIPHDLDILQVMKVGIPGTSMPGWNSLGMKDWKTILTYIKSFSPRFATESAGELIPIPEETPKEATEESIKEGRHLYETGGCVSCHGPDGKGDGPAAGNLKDAWGNPILPRDLRRGPFKWGNTNRDVYRTMALGIPGTPMPAYEQKFTPAQRWQIVHYLKSIQQMPKGYDASKYDPSKPEQYLIRIVKLQGEIPIDFKAPEWQKIKEVPVFLKPLWNENKGAEWLWVKALHNDKEIAFDLSWEDDHAETLAPQSDAVAVQYPLKKISDPSELPYLGMGSLENPVLIWEWKPSGIKEWTAKGTGNLAAREASEQHTSGRGIYEDGRWHVVFRRSLQGQGKEDVSFDAIGYLSLALWDASLPGHKGPMAFSEWLTYEIEP